MRSDQGINSRVFKSESFTLFLTGTLKQRERGEREEREMEVAVFLVCSVLAVVSGEVQYQHPEEWQLWKTEHGKSYQSQREELDRHLVWLSNREYIDSHNANSHIFGFTLAMNHFGDLVSLPYTQAPLINRILFPRRLTQSMRKCT